MALSLPTAKVVPIREGMFPDPAESPHAQPRPDSDTDDADLVPIDPVTAAAIAAHGPDLLRHARRLMPSANDAQDLVQDTFERAIRAFAQFRPGSNLRAWLYTIMVRLARDQFRRRRARRTDELDIETVPTPEEEPPAPAWCAITQDQIRAALAEVSPVLREVFELHELQNLAYLEIARRLDIPVNTVASRLRRARERLRDLLSEPALRRETV
jgi:RNA polymerase sigma-70 factor, ECF subfamily